MAKRNSHQLTQPQLEIPIVNVPCQFRDQSAAFQLGARDAFVKTRVHRKFALPVSASAYAAGLMAGVAARHLTPKR